MTVLGSDIRGLHFRTDGQVHLSGALLRRLGEIDRAIVGLAARRWNAVEHRFPSFLEASSLQRVGYLRSFPHLATMAVNLEPTDDNLDRFRSGAIVDDEGAVALTATSPVRHILTPAACYHAYVHLEGSDHDRPYFLTTRNTCFRRESEYRPLERQWAFEMREVLVVGTAAEVDEFLLKAAEVVEELQSMLGITTEWTLATDPFFRPESSGAYLMQRLDPVKYEAVFRSRLAIASTNKHHDHFGRAFGISRNGEPATSGCVAFGLERWLAALVATHGPDATSWPPVLEAIDA